MIHIWRNGTVDHRGELEDWRRRGTVELEKERTEDDFWRGEVGGDGELKDWRMRR